MSRLTFTTLLIVAVLASSTTLAGQADIGFKGFGGRVGYVSPSNLDGTVGYGAIVDLGWINARLGWDLSLDAWTETLDVDYGKTRWNDIILGTRVRWHFDDPANKTGLYGFAGPAVHFATAKFTPTGGTELSETDSQFGLDVGFGASYMAGEDIDLILEGAYRAVKDIGQFTVMGGVVFRFGP